MLRGVEARVNQQGTDPVGITGTVLQYTHAPIITTGDLRLVRSQAEVGDAIGQLTSAF